ncbi:lantibiotic dehydratase [Actinomadura flavalba]|uniref:lantibiotic dehydratase n=1 Tax=Actinomadura flavalba TaxID=1120938 RepID=UPI0023E360D2|nr:lantibiotic dehydratase [Actinomadura flavalba]
MDAALYRASAFSGELAPSWWPRLYVEGGVQEACRWIREVWSDARVAEAVAVASPRLAVQIEQICDGRAMSTSRARSVVMSLARYLVRMSARPTPFGLFAGVAVLEFGDRVAVSWEPRGQSVRTRAHAVWLARLLARLESHPSVLCNLAVTTNDLVVERGDRLVIPWQPHATDPTRPPAKHVSLRSTPVIGSIVDAARAPVVFTDLVGTLTAQFPDLPSGAAEALLARLVGIGALVTSLRPPSTSGDGLAHILETFAATKAASPRDASPFLTELEDIAALLAANHPSAGVRARELVEVEHPVAVDLRLGGRLVLPSAVTAEASAAADALMRLTPHPFGVPGWQAYHEAFLARFGAHALVPVAALVDPVAGLGYPAHFAEPAAELPPELTVRDAQLLRLAQRAALDGADEMVLRQEDIDDLQGDASTFDRGEVRVPPHLEICAQLWASSPEAVAAGDFRLVLSSISRTGIALAGRFTDLLPESEQQRRRIYAQLPTSVQGALAAQLSFPPIHAHLENVVRAPQLLPTLVTLAEHRAPAADRITLDDLAVTADKNGMYLVSQSRGRVVEPVLVNAAARRVMPPMARLLFELPRARSAACSPFAWGAARCLPFLPRVVYGRTVLAMARWSLPARDLPDPNLTDRAWRDQFDVLRAKVALPDTVSVGDSDLRLRLRLDEPMDLALLRDHLDKARTAGSTVLISEAGTAADHGWFDGRAHELIVPVAATRAAAPAPRAVTRRPTRSANRSVLPGTGTIAFAKLYSDPQLFDLILTEHLPVLLEAWTASPTWWFVRYRDPSPHLRLRLHLADQDHQGLAYTRIGAWAEQLRARGLLSRLVFDTHVAETTRYGDGAAQRAAEALFAADSNAVHAQLTTQRADRALAPLALTAAGRLDLATALTGGSSAGARWLIDHPPAPSTCPMDRATARRAQELTEPDSVLALPGGQNILRAWETRRAAADAYRRLWTSACLEADTVIGSLLHMNHVRSVGLDPEREHACQRLARSAALARVRRQEAVR